MDIAKLTDLRGKSAVVTGGAGGIGAACARTFAAAGANVAIIDKNAEAAHQTALEIAEEFGVHTAAFECDVISAADDTDVIERAAAALKGLNILVNNTGGGGGGAERFEGLSADYINKIFSLNVYSVFRFSRLALPHMRAAGYGSIVNISSMASIMSGADMSVYSASKAAVNALTRQMAIDVAPVRVNAIAPGAIKTHALATVLTEPMERKMLEKTPLGRLGAPEDIANAALFFASPMASWVSGQTLIVSGGGYQTLD
ncbi:MAG: glucose 1-dehydrogenase [Cloacibacillus sp.]